MLSRNDLASAENPCWYPHDNVRVRKLFFFCFAATSGQKDFGCWRPFSDVLKLSVCQHFFLTQKECKYILKYFFSYCIVLTACQCFYTSALFITFKQSATFSGDLWSFIDKGIFCRTTFNLKIFILFTTNLFKNNKFCSATKNAQTWWNFRWCFYWYFSWNCL